MLEFRQAISRHSHPAEAIGECLYQLFNASQLSGPEDIQTSPPDIAFVSFSVEAQPKHKERDDISRSVHAVKELLKPTLCIGIPSTVVGYGGSVSDGLINGLVHGSQSAVLITAAWCRPSEDAGDDVTVEIETTERVPAVQQPKITAHVLQHEANDPRVAVPESLINSKPAGPLLIMSSPELLANGQLHMLMTELGMRFPHAVHSAMVVDANFGPGGQLLLADGNVNYVDGLILDATGCTLPIRQHNASEMVSLDAPSFNFVPRHMMAVIAEAHEQEENWSQAASIQVSALLNQGVSDALELLSGPRWLSLDSSIASLH